MSKPQPQPQPCIDCLNDVFHLPIFYDPQKKALADHIIDDLEFIVSADASTQPLYVTTLGADATTESPFGQELLKQVPRYYSHNTAFLKDTQKLLKAHASSEADAAAATQKQLNDVYTVWKEIRGETSFKEKYLYLDGSFWEHLNRSETFLQCMSLYNVLSPAISLVTPILLLLVPFFMIQIRGLPVTWTEYMSILKVLANHHSIGRILMQFHTVSWDKRLYMAISAAFYLFSLYQNIRVCIQFHKNMTRIHQILHTLRDYLQALETRWSAYDSLVHAQGLRTPIYAAFHAAGDAPRARLRDYQKKLVRIGVYAWNPAKIAQVGSLLQTFYEFYDDVSLRDAFLYSFGQHAYLDYLQGLGQQLRCGDMHFATFPSLSKKNKEAGDNKKDKDNKKKRANKDEEEGFTDFVYPPLATTTPVKNSVTLQRNMIVTGPNASGKTTVLKTTLVNIILSQQWGCGFYRRAHLRPYHYLYCYLNIPDTSGRDSLFQAEARRCKNILDNIDQHPRERHFCVFDELFSGTNPEEAVSSSCSLMEYLARKPNVYCLLTTHFVDVCRILEAQHRVVNWHMAVDVADAEAEAGEGKADTIYLKDGVKRSLNLNGEGKADTIYLKDEVKRSLNLNGEGKADTIYRYQLRPGISYKKGGWKVLRDLAFPKDIVDYNGSSSSSSIAVEQQ
jgi:MutS domain V